MTENCKYEGTEKMIPTPSRQALERRVTCQYYSPTLVLSSNDEKRLQVVLELFQTEERYIYCLHTLKTVFEDKLRESNIIPVKDIEAIFPAALEEIRDIHDRLCDILRTRILQWDYRNKVADIFVQFFSNENQFDVLGHYSSYSNNFPKAIRTISRCARNSVEFEYFLQNCSNGPSWKGLDLHALLLNPIQRLPRYVLLLKQLNRFTDASHPDRKHGEQALAAMSHTVTILNNSIESSLKVASEYTTRKRHTRRRSPIYQRDAIKVLNRPTEQLTINREIKNKTEETSNSTSQSRPASICSSISSGYASGEEGDSVQTTSCRCNGPACTTRHHEFSRVRHESALQQLAQQKFDFSRSVISPTLQRLHAMKRAENVSAYIDKAKGNVSDSNTLSSEAKVNEPNNAECKIKHLKESEKEDDATEDIDTETIDQTMSNFIEDFSTTINNIENIHQMNLLSNHPPYALTRRSYSDGLSLGDQATCGTERDLNDLSPLYETPLTRQSSSKFQRFQKYRRSWAPQSSLSKNSTGDLSSPSLLTGSLNDVVIEDDNVSIWSDLSTLSGDSNASGVSALSMPVDGRHATKRRYFRLKHFFKQLRGGRERRYMIDDELD